MGDNVTERVLSAANACRAARRSWPPELREAVACRLDDFLSPRAAGDEYDAHVSVDLQREEGRRG